MCTLIPSCLLLLLWHLLSVIVREKKNVLSAKNCARTPQFTSQLPCYREKKVENLTNVFVTVWVCVHPRPLSIRTHVHPPGCQTLFFPAVYHPPPLVAGQIFIRYLDQTDRPPLQSSTKPNLKNQRPAYITLFPLFLSSFFHSLHLSLIPPFLPFTQLPRNPSLHSLTPLQNVKLICKTNPCRTLQGSPVRYRRSRRRVTLSRHRRL